MSTAPSNEGADDALAQAKPPFLRRVRIRGYKSIAFCDVTLEPLTILVGRNASGKSNFLDALAFLSDAVRLNLAEAIYRHGGPLAIRHRNSPKGEVSFEATCQIEEAGEHYELVYTLSFALDADAVPQARSEGMRLRHVNFDRSNQSQPAHRVVGKQLDWVSSDPRTKLSLPDWGEEPGPTLTAHLASMRVYNFLPDVMRQPQRLRPVGFLDRDGSNVAGVLAATRQRDAWRAERVGRYLKAVAQSVELVGSKRYGEYETVGFRVPGQAGEFDAASMSDGTLRIFGALVAAFQDVAPYGSPSLVAIEEPEAALHPAAMRALVAALDEATLWTQILLTTHSPDLLDATEVKPENVRVVQMIDGQTTIGPVDEAGVEIVARKLSTLGGLERENQLEPDLDDQDRQRELAGAQQEGHS